MKDNSCQTHTGSIVGNDSLITIEELCQTCSIDVEYILNLVDEGVIEPIGSNSAQWRFAELSLLRIKTVIRLQRDLGVNVSGAALVLDLLDEVKFLRAKIDRMSI